MKAKDNSIALDLSVAALKALRGLYDNPEAEFKSTEQAQAVKLAMQRSEDILVILPTGAGKSITFMGPAWAEKGMTTVVIVPFVALIKEMKERCTDLGLSCYIWHNSGTLLHRKTTQVLLVGVENSITTEFQQFLVRLEQSEKLARIVMDECHTVVTQRNFRSYMRRLPSVIRFVLVEIFLTIRCVSVQVQLLTATLPIKMEERLQAILGCEKMTVIRQISERVELKYKVITLPMEGNDKEDMDIEVGTILESKLEEFEENDRAIIYCLKRKWAEELALFLNTQLEEKVCGTYHADMEEEEREEIFKRWKSGDILCVVATSALGAGIDHSGVRVVIHHGHARSMIDLIQESGRGGRDGDPAECITVFWPGILEETEWLDEEERDEVLEWIQNMGCRRLGIGEYLNGSEVDCLSLRNAQHCDRCEVACGKEGRLGFRGGMSLGRRRSSGALLEAREVQDGADIREMIVELRGRCPVCFFAGRRREDRHELHRCRYLEVWRIG
jgi:superfamily II DNA helicase RecQ